MKILTHILLSITFVTCTKGQSIRKSGIDTRSGKTPEGLALYLKAPDFKGTDQHGNTIHLHDIL